MDGTTNVSIKYHAFKDYFTQFYKTTVKALKRYHFRSNGNQFVFGIIAKYDNNIYEQVKKKKDDTLSTSKWNFQNSVPFKIILLDRQDSLYLKHMGKR